MVFDDNSSVLENAEHAIADALHQLHDKDDVEKLASLLAGALGVMIVRSGKPLEAAKTITEMLMRFSAEQSIGRKSH